MNLNSPPTSPEDSFYIEKWYLILERERLGGFIFFLFSFFLFFLFFFFGGGSEGEMFLKGESDGLLEVEKGRSER